MEKKILSLEEWKAIGTEKFGSDVKNWKFKCANCGETQTLQDFIDANEKDADSMFYFSCIGRIVKGRGCDWTLGGLFRIHETEVIGENGNHVPVFEFAD